MMEDNLGLELPIGSKLLVSFCNVFPNDLALGIFDYQNNQFQWVDLERTQKIVHGITEIISLNNQYFCLTQLGENSGLSVLNSKMELEIFFPFLFHAMYIQ